MCGRFTLRTPTPVLIEHFGLGHIPALPPRFNIAPTQQVAVIRSGPGGTDRSLAMLRWGLIPSWAKDAAIGNRMINARGETVSVKPSFRRAYRRRRCLVAADGFYEWQKQGSQKQPYFIHRHDDRPLALAGLWESWDGSDDTQDAIESFTIVTIHANELMKPIHDRMPVILSPCDYLQWLDPNLKDTEPIDPLLVPFAGDELVAEPVSTYVNRPTHDDPKCVEIMA